MTTRSSRGPGGATAVTMPATTARPPADGGSGSESSDGDFDDEDAVFEAAAARAGAVGALVPAFSS